jgi:hypothetical protein
VSDKQKHQQSGKQQDDTPERPSQAEGERSPGHQHDDKPERPSQAEGERETVKQEPRQKRS